MYSCLCNDCLRAVSLPRGVDGTAACVCGGDCCDCASCLSCLDLLRAGERDAVVLGVVGSVEGWTAEGGVPSRPHA